MHLPDVMQATSYISIILIVINCIISYKGLTNGLFFESYCFSIDGILKNKDYIRLLSSGFLHVSWQHLIFNMISLYLFSQSLELYVGPWGYVFIYFSALIGGDLLSLFIHRNHGDYTAVGASGAICGIIFGSIALFPGMSIGMFFLPIGIPGWIYGLVYILYSIYGIRSKSENVGHDAHLGGALIGLCAALMLKPNAITYNYPVILTIVLPAVIFIYIIITRPQTLLVDSFYYNQHKGLTIDDRYNMTRAEKQKEVDRILEKIHNKGISSLTKSEKERLDEYAHSR